MPSEEPLPKTPPMDGVVVIDLTRFFAGPLATSWMGDMGADVIKVERPPAGDHTREVDHLLPGGMSSYFAGLNRSKRSILLDLTTDLGVATLRRLIEQADVLVENFRPEVMNKLGLGYEQAHKINNRLVYCSISSFGDSGPLVNKPGMDIIVQAMGGVMGITGLKGGTPTRVGAPVADYVGALQTMVSVLLALNERTRSGRGQYLSVSLLEGQVAMLSNYMAGFFVTGQPNGPVGNLHPQLVPYQPYATQDGEVIVACLTEEFWRRMCVAVGLEDLLDDQRFSMIPDRVAHREELNSILIPTFGAMTNDELISRLEEADVPCSPIHSIADVVGHPQVVARETILEIDLAPTEGSYHAVAAPFRLNRTPARTPTRAPFLGEHTAEVLQEHGFSRQEIAALVGTTVPGAELAHDER